MSPKVLKESYRKESFINPKELKMAEINKEIANKLKKEQWTRNIIMSVK